MPSSKPTRPRATFPARLHVLVARDAPVGLVIRRGPSKSVCTVLWDRRRGAFKTGQWMRGRIYERRCDLSPDGKHFLYFAMNGRRDSNTRGAWTAVARVPYLKALDLHAKGDCWHGGGLFRSNSEYWLNDGSGHTPLQSSSGLRCNRDAHPPDYFGGECLTVYYNRLQRDGWTLHNTTYQGATLFEKPLAKGWTLRKLAYAEIDHPAGRGCYWDAHELRQESTNTILAFPEWEWADEVEGRLAFAVHGQLRTAGLGRGKLHEEKLLHDFNDMKFAPLPAPY